MDRKLDLKNTTAGELKKFLAGIPDETQLELYDSGEAIIEEVMLEYETWDIIGEDMLSLDITSANSIY